MYSSSIPTAIRRAITTGGTKRAGSRFNVRICLIPSMPRPLLKIKIPPTRLISVIRASVIKVQSHLPADRYSPASKKAPRRNGDTEAKGRAEYRRSNSVQNSIGIKEGIISQKGALHGSQNRKRACTEQQDRCGQSLRQLRAAGNPSHSPVKNSLQIKPCTDQPPRARLTIKAHDTVIQAWLLQWN